MSVVALIVAAGRSTRFGGMTPKPYAALAGRPVLSYGLATIGGHPDIDAVRVVIHEDHLPLYEQSLAYCPSGISLLKPVVGGEERQDSVRLGLDSMSPLSPSQVVIHDAARPFVTGALIDRVLAPLRGNSVTCAGSVAALPVADTVKRAEPESSAGGTVKVTETLDRRGLWRAQTPQAFMFDEIALAHERSAGGALTDDAAVAEATGLDVVLVPGDDENFKITTSDDLDRAEMLLAARLGDVRVGNGIDTHRFGPGDHVVLCGIAIPHDKGLRGHSDADAALHAVTDALLGSIGAGDIGVHFPPSDDEWRDRRSEVFASFAAERVREANGALMHVDVTIVCESPRIAPHRVPMQASLAAILGIDTSRVSIKGTTTEGLGFTGRGEGITAVATATVRLPLGRTIDDPTRRHPGR